MQNEEDKSSQYLKEIQELEEKNKNLLKENDELKQSNIILIKSSSPDLIKISQSKISEKLSGIYDITDKNEINDYDNNNNKEIINELKIENEKLKKQIEEFKLGKHEREEQCQLVNEDENSIGNVLIESTTFQASLSPNNCPTK